MCSSASSSSDFSSPLRDLTTDRDYFASATPSSLIGHPQPPEFYSSRSHVLLPCYDETRWNSIKVALNRIATAGPSLTFSEFTVCIRSYATFQRTSELDFSALEALIDSGWYEQRLLSELLPTIARLALELPSRFRRPIRLLLAHQNGSITLSQHQAAVLLANAFYCTFEQKPASRHFPRINFHAIFRCGKIRVEKLRFLLHYFAQFAKYGPDGTLSIIRQRSEKLPEGWEEMPLSAPVTPFSDGRIEDEGAGQTQLDFANSFMGGGVLRGGAVQEEIRFLICPELIVSCLVSERMQDDEAILVVGAERFSNYSGYANTLRWQYRERTEPSRDSLGRAEHTEVLAIDALSYGGKQAQGGGYQYNEEAIGRELLKAFAGFSLRTPHSPLGLATGNWGCGAFGGDIELKSLIQWMASCLVRPGPRPLLYFTFGDSTFANQLGEIVNFLHQKNVTIGQLYRTLLDYGHALRSGIVVSKRAGGEGLFYWVYSIIGESEEDEREEE